MPWLNLMPVSCSQMCSCGAEFCRESGLLSGIFAAECTYYRIQPSGGMSDFGLFFANFSYKRGVSELFSCLARNISVEFLSESVIKWQFCRPDFCVIIMV